MHQAGIPMTRDTRAEMDRLWEEAKAHEGAGKDTAGKEP